MSTAVWALLAAAVLLVPIGPRRPVADPVVVPTRVRPARITPARLAVLTVAGACVAAFGVPAGVGVAIVACPAVTWGLRWLAQRPVRVQVDRSVALALDLAAAALRTGRPLGDALDAAAPAANPDVRELLLRVAGLLRLGATAEQAWEPVRAGPLRHVAAAAVRSAASGIRLAATFEQLAAEIRAEAVSAASVRAHRAGVVAMAPLGACFLPSFVCLGIIPVVVGIARTVTGVLP